MLDLSLGALRYAEDHGEHFPHADRWQTELAPYVNLRRMHYLRKIAFNNDLSGVSLDDLSDPAQTCLFFESTLPRTAGVDAIPLRTETGMFAVTFTDGHGYPLSLGARDQIIRTSRAGSAPHHAVAPAGRVPTKR